MNGENTISIHRRSDEAFEVVVKRRNGEALTVEAANAPHATMIATSLATLVRQKDPESPLIVDTAVRAPRQTLVSAYA